MDGLFHGKPYFFMDDLGVPLFFGNTHILFVAWLPFSNFFNFPFCWRSLDPTHLLEVWSVLEPSPLPRIEALASFRVAFFD